MRLERLYASTYRRSNALESAGIGCIVLALAIVLTQRSYESFAIIDVAPARKDDIAYLARLVRQAASPDGARPAVILGLRALGAGRLRLSCRCEDPRYAQQACERATRAATTALGNVRARLSPPHAPHPDEASRYAMLAPLAALAWLFLRGLQTYAAGSPVLQPRLPGSGAEPVQSIAPHSAITEPAASHDSSAHRPRRIRTIMGMPSLPPPSAASADPHSQPEDQVLRPSHAARKRVHAANDSTPAAKLHTRVVFQVGGSPYQPDTQVLTQRTLEQLRALRAELLSGRTGHQVLRIASDVGSRYAKTQVAAQLAALLADSDAANVLLAEGDSEAPALHRVVKLQAPLGLGFSEQLQRLHTHPAQAMVSVIRIEGGLHALLESRASSPAAFGLPLFTAVIEELRPKHDFIIVDGPIVDTWPDATPLTDSVDGVIWVTAAGTPWQQSLRLARQHFEPDMLLSVVKAGDWAATGTCF